MQCGQKIYPIGYSYGMAALANKIAIGEFALEMLVDKVRAYR